MIFNSADFFLHRIKSTRRPTVLNFCWSTYGLPVRIMVILLSDIPAAVDLNRTWSGPLLLCLCSSSPTFFYKANPPASICWLNCCRPETHHEWDYLSGATSLCHKVDSLSTHLCEALLFLNTCELLNVGFIKSFNSLLEV